MAISSIAYQATVLRGVTNPVDWLNDTGADVEVGTIIQKGSVNGIVVAGNSQDGSTKVLSTQTGTAVFGPPGFEALVVAFTTSTWATGTLLYWDTSNNRATSTAAGSNSKLGYAATSKATAVSTATVYFNQTLVV